MRNGSVLLIGVPLTVFCILLTTSTRAYPGGPDPGVTGGFGEQTCNKSGCHASFALNAGRASGLGDLLVSGLPKYYEAGKSYTVKLAISHAADRRHWGFQLAARVKATGAQAGELRAIDGNTQVLEKNAVQYIEHSLEGITTNVFTFNWVAPGSPAGEVIMHVSGNAANGDLSSEGDYIYSTAVTVSPPVE